MKMQTIGSVVRDNVLLGTITQKKQGGYTTYRFQGSIDDSIMIQYSLEGLQDTIMTVYGENLDYRFQ